MLPIVYVADVSEYEPGLFVRGKKRKGFKNSELQIKRFLAKW